MISAGRIFEAAQADAKRFDAQYGTHVFSNAVENVQWAGGWADNRQDPKAGIFYGNWNDIGGYDNQYRTNPYSHRARTLVKRLGDLLEKAGAEIDWCDQVTTCDDCGKLVQTQPDCYSWQPEYVDTDGGIVCAKCLEGDAGEYLEDLEGTTKGVICTVDPGEHGYVKIESGLERGFHSGQDADPRVIAKALRAQGVSRFLFQVDDVGQFDASFSVWVHEDESEKTSLLWKDGKIQTDGPSVSEAMKRGLQAAAQQSGELQGPGIRYSKINEDGTAETRLVSQEEFIAGVKS